MELKYGHSETYKHNLDKERLNWLTDQTNRSNGQTQFLFQLVDGDFERLKEVETQMKNCLVSYCPDDKETLDEVMAMTPKTKWFELK